MRVTANTAKVTKYRTARNVALFLAAPFIGLAYAIALTFVGAGALVWLGIRAARTRTAAA